MLVRDVMKQPVCVSGSETLDAVARILKNDDVGCLPVCDGDQVLGMITDRDVLTRCVAANRDASEMTAREAMTTDAYSCLEDETLEQAAATMADKQVRRLPVLNSDQRLVGVISATDLTGGKSKPARFEVVFYKDLYDSYGRPHHSEVTRVNIAAGHTKDEAVGAAIQQVEHENRAAWNAIADGYDVTEVHHDELGKIVEVIEKTWEKDERIRRRAYALWESKGSLDGGQEGHWTQAVREIGAADALARANSAG